MENEFVYNNHVRIIIRVKLAYLCKQPDKIFEKSLRNRHNKLDNRVDEGQL